jgi:hypothetical protein
MLVLRAALPQPGIGRRRAPLIGLLASCLPIGVHVEVDVTEVALDAEAWRRFAPLDP